MAADGVMLTPNSTRRALSAILLKRVLTGRPAAEFETAEAVSAWVREMWPDGVWEGLGPEGQYGAAEALLAMVSDALESVPHVTRLSETRWRHDLWRIACS